MRREMVTRNDDGEKDLRQFQGPEQANEGNTNHGEFELSYIKHKLDNLYKLIVQEVECKVQATSEEILQEMRQRELQKNEFNNFAKSIDGSNATWSNRLHQPKPNESSESETSKKGRRRKALPEKVFVARESYLTALLEVKHMKSIYNIFFISVVIFVMKTVCYDFLREGQIILGYKTFSKGFRGIYVVVTILALMHIPIVGVHTAVQVWATVRKRLAKNEIAQSIWSYFCLIVFVCFQASLLYVGSHACYAFNLPFITGSAMLVEISRLIMKVHGFVRTIAGRILSNKLKVDDDIGAPKNHTHIPPISCYIYYLFAPTLLYRDNYPRTSSIRWKFAFGRLIEIFAVAFLFCYIYEHHLYVYFGNYGKEPETGASLTVKVFGMMLPGFIVFLGTFYLILHSWLNFTSELLRFGDRMFYKDWWTASNYEAYYRNWNVVVHDWLYEYIYKDFYNHIFKGSKVASSLMVFLVSAYVHEHIIAFGLQMFYPVMFVCFGFIGVTLVFFTKLLSERLGNMIIWLTLITGNGIMLSLYAMEYFARLNCPQVENKTWIQQLIPVSWTCFGNTSN